MSKKIWLWTVLFVVGLFTVLFRMDLSRYISDLTSLLAAGCILAVIAGTGLLMELYGK